MRQQIRRRKGVDRGQLTHLPDIPTLAGIRQSYRIHEVSKQVQEGWPTWSLTEALWAAGYAWARSHTSLSYPGIQLAQGDRTATAKYATKGSSLMSLQPDYLMSCSGIRDGKGWTLEQAAEDMEWCSESVERKKGKGSRGEGQRGRGVEKKERGLLPRQRGGLCDFPEVSSHVRR